MGGNQSTEEFLNTPLIAQQRFVGTMSQRYVRPRQVTLELADQFWSQARPEGVEIRELTADTVLFRIAGFEENNLRKQTLLDSFKVPVLRMESRSIGPRGAGYSVYPGGPSAATRFIDFQTEMTPFEKPLRMNFVDRMSGAQVKIGVTGKWLSRTAVIWTESGQWQARYSIARIYRTADTPEASYRLDVAPGVDLQLMVCICAALDEQSKKHEIGGDKKAKKAAKEAAKAAKKAGKSAPAAVTA